MPLAVSTSSIAEATVIRLRLCKELQVHPCECAQLVIWLGFAHYDDESSRYIVNAVAMLTTRHREFRVLEQANVIAHRNEVVVTNPSHAHALTDSNDLLGRLSARSR